MKVVLLCAGYATRLYPLTKDQPKPLLPVGEKCIIDHLLTKIEATKLVDQVFLVTNDRFYSHFKNWAESARYPWKIEVMSDGTQTNETRLGAIGDLNFVLRKFKVKEDLAVFAGDNLFSFDLKDFFTFAESHRPFLSIGAVNVKKELASHYGIVRTDQQGQVLEFLEKPEAPPSTLASTGIYWFSKQGLDFLDRYTREGHNADRPGDYVRWLVQVDRVFAYRFEALWFDIGDKHSYKEAQRLFPGKEEKKIKK